MIKVRSSAFRTVTLGALAYVIASLARTAVTSHIEFSAEFARTVDISALYVIAFLPGCIVGRLNARSFLVLGFVAGYAGEIVRNVVHMIVQLVNLQDGASLVYPNLAVMISVLTHSIPNGILAAAGGALGWAWQHTAKQKSIHG